MLEQATLGFPSDLRNPALSLPPTSGEAFAAALRLFAGGQQRFWPTRERFDFSALTAAFEAELGLSPQEARRLMLRVVSFYNLLVGDIDLAEGCADIKDPGSLSEFAIVVAARMPLRPWATTLDRPTFDPAAFRAAMRGAMH